MQFRLVDVIFYQFVLALIDEVDFDGEVKDILHLMDLDPSYHQR